MKEFWSWLQVGFAALGGFTSWFFGHNDGLLTALVVFVIADYVSGVLRAIVEQKVSSSIGSRGISKKVVIFHSGWNCPYGGCRSTRCRRCDS